VLNGRDQQIRFKPRYSHSVGCADELETVGIVQDVPIEGISNLAEKRAGVDSGRNVIDGYSRRLIL